MITIRKLAAAVLGASLITVVMGCSSQPQTASKPVNQVVTAQAPAAQAPAAQAPVADKQSATPPAAAAPGQLEPVKATSAGTAQSAPTATAAPQGETVPVLSVVDGDTIKVTIGGKTESVRLIGVDTPETVHPSKPVQPYGPEASAFTKRWLTGQNVRLEFDAEERDQYGRLLAYVWLGNELFNATLVKEGFGQVLTIPPNVKYADRFVALQREARENNRGLWGLDVAAQQPAPAAAPAPKPAAAPAPAPKPAPAPAPAPAPTESSVYYKNCTAARAAGVTPIHRGEPGYAKHLDRDNDGIACE